MSTIPPAVITVPIPDPITHIQFLQQVMDNIYSQLVSLETEITKVDNNDGSEITSIASAIKEIKAKANSSTELISNALLDENKLKFINTKLRASGDTLKSIEKWIAIIKELEQELKNAEYDYYRIVADLLQEVLERCERFQPYRATSYVAAIMMKVSDIESELRRQVQWTFREIGPLAPSDPDFNPNARLDINLDMQNLNQVYLVVDVLGYPFRRDLLERFAQLQLLQYEKAFQFGTKYCGLDSLDRRYVWFRHLLKIVDEKLGEAFPKKWCVALHLFCEFTRRTKKHLGDYLADTYGKIDDPGKYVGMVLSSLKSILSFEAEMKASFDIQSRGEEDENAQVMKNIEPIADAFDSYLGPYVTLEREELDKLMERLNAEEMRAQYQPQSSSNNSNGSDSLQDANLNKGPYDSSRQMFEFIKASLKRCTTFSTGVTYLSLSREYRICLYNYAQSLKFRCPSPVEAPAGKPPLYNISKSEEIGMCRLVCTGEYCIDTIPPLEAKMKEHIKAEYRNEIDFSGQIDGFVDAISYTFGIMIAGICCRLDPIFKTMRKIDWSAVNTVGDDSQYVKDTRKVLNDVIPRVRSNISRVYFQNFNLKLVTAILDKLNDNIWKLERIATTGAGQLLLDLNGLKTYFLRMPQVGLQSPALEEYAPSKAYVTFIQQRISKIEVILKLVCAEEEHLEETFHLLWPDGTPENYAAIVNLKARTGLAAPIDRVGTILKKGANTVGLDKVGGVVKEGVSKVGDGVTHGISHGITHGGTSLFGGISHAAGDLKGFIMGGSLFEDSSKESTKPKGMNGHYPNTSTSTSSTTIGNSNGGTQPIRKPTSQTNLLSSVTASSASTNSAAPRAATSTGGTPKKA